MAALDKASSVPVTTPVPPVRQYSFTDWQVSNPTAPPPGDRMDAEYDRANASIAQVINWVEANVGLTTPPSTPGNFDSDAAGSAALAQDYADVTMAWAEHMPDTIPPNILAVMGVTGDHWSSRWWANQAVNIARNAGAFSGEVPPANPYPGQFWFDSANPQLYVWYVDPTSSQWVIATAYAGGLTTDAPSDGQTYGRQNGAWLNISGSGGYLPLTGATPMTGPLTLSGNATLPLHAVPLQQLTSAVTIPVPAGGSIQAAHDALPATGGSILLAANTTYVLTAKVIIGKPNVHISAPSWGTIVQRSPGYASDILIQATGANCTVEGFTIDGNSVVTTVMELVIGGDNSLVQRMQIINSAGSGHLTLAGNNSRATGNTIKGLGTSPATQTGYGIWALNHQTVLIENNTISGTGIDGIGADGHGTQIIGNRVFGCHCWASSSGGQIATYPTISGAIGNCIVVAGNTVGPGGAVTAHGIEAGAANMVITGNTVDGVGSYGILVISSGSTITGNYLRNISTQAGIDGIEILAGVSDFVVSGNRIADDRATPQMRAGIWVTAGSSDRYVITGNMMMPNTVTGVVDQGSGRNKTIGFNAGYDNIIPSVASAATIALPMNPVITLTGTAAVTAIDTTFSQATGRTITIIPAGASSFVAGSNIANSVTAVPGIPITAVFDGALWHLSTGGALPMTGGILSGPLTVTTLTSTGGSIASNNATSNIVNLSNHGLGPPTLTTRSAGTKLVLYDLVSGVQTDTALGVQSNGMWFGNSTGNSFSFYTGTTLSATLNNFGSMILTGGLGATLGMGLWGATAPAVKPTVSGAKGSNAALASLLTALAAYGLITDSTSA